MEEFKPIVDYVNSGAYTIESLSEKFKVFEKEELEEILDGFVLFKMIKKTNGQYHGNDIPPPEKIKKQSTDRRFTGNSLDMSGVSYPDWVVTDRDKLKFLTSPEAPKFQKTFNFFVDDIDTKETGRLIYDSLNSNHIMTSYYISADNKNGGNKIDYKKDVTQSRGMTITHSNGKFKVSVSLLKTLIPRYANSKTESYVDRFEAEFDTYEEFAAWLKKNL